MKLQRHAGRRRSGRFLAEGPNLVAAAAERGLVDEVFVTDEAARRHGSLIAGLPVYPVTERAAKALSETVTPSGLVAVCRLPATGLDEVLAECLRALAPGGRLFVTTPNGEDLDVERTICPECGCTFHRWQHVRSWTAQSLASRLSAVGFGPVEAREITWGNELIDLGFSLLGRKKTGIYAVATKPSADPRQH